MPDDAKQTTQERTADKLAEARDQLDTPTGAQAILEGVETLMREGARMIVVCISDIGDVEVWAASPLAKG